MLKPSLISALRKATALSISMNPTTIELIPHKRVPQGGGVYKFVAQPARSPQVFSIEPVSSTLSGIAGAGGGITGEQGAQGHSWSYNITGRYDCQIEINDTWDNGDTHYRVIALQPDNGYEKVGVVDASGKDPAYG